MSDQWTYYREQFSIFHSRIWATSLWSFILTQRVELLRGHFWRAVCASESQKAYLFSPFPMWRDEPVSCLRCDVEAHVISKQLPFLARRLILIEWGCFGSSLQAEGDFLLRFAESSLLSGESLVFLNALPSTVASGKENAAHARSFSKSGVTSFCQPCSYLLQSSRRSRT